MLNIFVCIDKIQGVAELVVACSADGQDQLPTIEGERVLQNFQPGMSYVWSGQGMFDIDRECMDWSGKMPY